MKDICSKRNLWCECKHCREAWREAYDELGQELSLGREEYDYENESELDIILEKDGW